MCAAAVVVAAYFSPSLEEGANGPRQISREGLERIVKSEGCMYCAYRDGVNVWTVGVGATRDENGEKIKPGLVLSDHEISLLLRRDIKNSLKCVSDKMNGWKMPQTVYDSAVDLAFNIGCSGATYNPKRKSETSISKLANKGEWQGVCGHLTDFVWSGGRRSAGLINRRTDQKNYCLSGLDS